MRKKLASILLCALVMVGCTPIEQSARDGIATAKGFLDQEKIAHPECKLGTTASVCSLIGRGIAAKDVTIDALEAYCGGAAFDTGGPCTPHAALKDKLTGALQNLNQTINDLKKVGQ